jgi:hypothetical protein
MKKSADYTTVPKELSAAEQSKKKKKKPESKMPPIEKTMESIQRLEDQMKGEEMIMKKYMAGGKVGRGCGSAMRGGGAVMKKGEY